MACRKMRATQNPEPAPSRPGAVGQTATHEAPRRRRTGGATRMACLLWTRATKPPTRLATFHSLRWESDTQPGCDLLQSREILARTELLSTEVVLYQLHVVTCKPQHVGGS
mmetsp:Transcript_4871/g.12565  ORF Transcript_4871/g.12565 Transcript_4871/m.12565 type:complete len:111 (+) Transcript_4871:919-1251(+)